MTTITRYRGRTSIAISLIAALLLAVPAQRTQAAGNPNPRIIPIGARPLGKTYGEWGAAWWQYAFSIPVPTNPLFDQTGANCGVDQSGPVFFLVGVINATGTAARSCTVPANKMLFFPILNYENDNLCPPNTPPLGVAPLQAGAQAAMDSVTALEANIDGVQVANPFAYRAASPGGFNVTFPDNNVFQSFGCSKITAGSYAPFVSDGYWLMLAPLSAGQHKIHFSGSEPGFNLDITYDLTVLAS